MTEPRPLTDLERGWVEDHLEIAERAAKHAFRWHHLDDPGLDYEDVTSSAYYGLSRAPLEDGFQTDPIRYAGMNAKHWIWNDRRAFANRTRGNTTIRYEDYHETGSPEDGPDAIAIRLDDVRRLRAGLRLLDDRQGQAIGWKLDGMPVAEMAQRAGVCERVMARRLRKGLDALAAWMTVRE